MEEPIYIDLDARQENVPEDSSLETGGAAQSEASTERRPVVAEQSDAESLPLSSSGFPAASLINRLAHTSEIAAPEKFICHEVGDTSAVLKWSKPDGLNSNNIDYILTYYSSTHENAHWKMLTPFQTATLKNLRPLTEYTVSLSVDCNKRRSANNCVHFTTKPSPPQSFDTSVIGATSVYLKWKSPDGFENIPHKFKMTWSESGSIVGAITSEDNHAEVSGLSPGTEYTFSISTVVEMTESRTQSIPVHTVNISTKIDLESVLTELGLHHHMHKKITLGSVLEINHEMIADKPPEDIKSLPCFFLRKLMMANVTARDLFLENLSCEQMTAICDLSVEAAPEGGINPLDLITALFLCSDGFLQQAMALKMSMCQFAVPLLLPNSDTSKCTLMVWALRDIVKEFRPHSMKENEFIETNIVLSDIPMVSFVRLGDNSLSKSDILNQVFSNPQQPTKQFIHREMEWGNIPRRISNGLVEVTWYLPKGNRKIDVFEEPLAVANLRGDIRDFETQFSFLCQTSTAVFVFCENILTISDWTVPRSTKSRVYIVCSDGGKISDAALRKQESRLGLQPKSILSKRKHMNDATFVKGLQSTVGMAIKSLATKMSITKMVSAAKQLEIPVDENNSPCQNGKAKADAVINGMTDIQRYKATQLPLQGTLWRDLSKLEKEECRLENVGSKNIELYKSELHLEVRSLREQQRLRNISDAMFCFIHGLESSREERSYFLKWMKLNLDNLTREQLSCGRKFYMKYCDSDSKDKAIMTNVERKIDDYSLGNEHFLRELGQLYELSISSPLASFSQEQTEMLPLLCAKMMLDGLPLELVDGEASNMPTNWVRAVLTELNKLTAPNSNIRVVSVLGVQSSGKSTLLNIMFGVQFAVSNGKCTRGAYMQLIKVKEDLRNQLGCDFIMVIDTEGLKSPELAELVDSHAHDNELATLVVGLSDITIINMSMENATEMKDTLQIVGHAFLRMKQVGKKKPCCLFVHQNMASVAAHEKSSKDRMLLLQQLNEMIEIAARMEKKGIMKFTDILAYDPEKDTAYIPNLWQGNPPMAPVNTGYCEAVDELKKRVIGFITENKREVQSILDFQKWTEDLWGAVKYENFIFSFRNSLVADAYTKLCIQFNKWDWAFRKHMYSWLREAETKISNAELVSHGSWDSTQSASLLQSLKIEGECELDKAEEQILLSLKDYYQKKKDHVYLVEMYKQDFVNSAKGLRLEIHNSIINRLETAMEIKKGKAKLEILKKSQSLAMEKQVWKLVDTCRQSTTEMREQQLEQEFEKTWSSTVAELPKTDLGRQNVVQEIYMQLRKNMAHSEGPVQKMLSKIISLDRCGTECFTVPEPIYENISEYELTTTETREMAQKIIERSKQFVAKKVETKSDYHTTHAIDLLKLIDDSLRPDVNAEFEASVKIHICGHASREFQQMHDTYIEDNDPRKSLERLKPQYLADFKDLFFERDQCKRKADEFMRSCLTPAVREYINKSLGQEIVDDIEKGPMGIAFKARIFFQYAILKHLLLYDDFESFVNYISHYKEYVKHWILNEILDHYIRGGNSISYLEDKILGLITQKIYAAIESKEKDILSAGNCGTKETNVCTFIRGICTYLNNKLVIPKDALDAVLALNNADPKQFSDCLKSFVAQMVQSLKAEFHNAMDVKAKLERLPIKPQDELFQRLSGCGNQCPFCKAPCESDSKNHTTHFVAIHRPEGIGRYRWDHSAALVPDICTSLIASNNRFQCRATANEWYPYKDYHEIYPNWRIQCDVDGQTSDYWKYVLTKYNKKFARRYKAKPAQIPPEWLLITQTQALRSLKRVYKVSPV